MIEARELGKRSVAVRGRGTTHERKDRAPPRESENGTLREQSLVGVNPGVWRSLKPSGSFGAPRRGRCSKLLSCTRLLHVRGAAVWVVSRAPGSPSPLAAFRFLLHDMNKLFEASELADTRVIPRPALALRGPRPLI